MKNKTIISFVMMILIVITFVLAENWNNENTTGLQAWYSFNTTSGFTTDTTGTYGLTMEGVVANTTAPDRPAGSGSYGNASLFADDTSKRFQQTAYRANESNGTIQAWVYSSDITPTNADAIVYARGAGAAQQNYGLIFDSGTGDLRFRLCQSSDYTCDDLVVSNPFSAINQWKHVAGVWNETTMMVYVNGSLIGEQARTKTAAGFAETGISIGVRTLNTAGSPAYDIPYNGGIDEVMLFNVTRNASEIFTDYNQTQPPALEIFNVRKITPTNLSYVQPTSVNLTCEISSVNGVSNLKNATLDLWSDSGSLVSTYYQNFPGTPAGSNISRVFSVAGNYNGTLPYAWNCRFCSDNDQCSYVSPLLTVQGNFSNFTLFLDNTDPVISLASPVIQGNLSHITSYYKIFEPANPSCFFSLDTSGNNSVGCTADNTFNVLNVSLTSLGFNQFGGHTYILYVRDSAGNNASSLKNFVVINKTAEKFSPTVLSTETNTLNITLNDSESAVTSVSLKFDNINYLSSLVSVNGQLKTYQAQVPLNGSFTGSKTFNWTVFGTYDSNTGNYTYTSQSQTIQNILLTPTSNGVACTDASAKLYTLNYTFRNETDNGFVTNLNVTSFYTVWVGSKSTAVNFTWSETHATSSYPVCIFPNYTIANADIKIIYGGESGFGSREFNLQNHQITNTTQHYDLYLASDGLTSTVTINVQDTSGIDLVGYLLKIYLRDYGNSTEPLKLVESAVTDLNGQVVTELDTTQYYQLEVWQSGSLLYTEPPFIIQSSEITLVVPLAQILDLDNMNNALSVPVSLTYSNLTGIITGSWIDTLGVLSQVCLQTYNLTSSSPNSFSYECSSDSSSSLTVNVGTDTSTQFRAILLGTSSADGNTYPLATLDVDLRVDQGLEGGFWFVIALLTLVMLFVPSVTAAIIVGIATLGILGYMLNIIPLPWGVFIGIVVVGVMLIILSKD